MIQFQVPLNENIDYDNTVKFSEFLMHMYSTLTCPAHPTANQEIAVKRLGDVFHCVPTSVCCDAFYQSVEQRADLVAKTILKNDR